MDFLKAQVAGGYTVLHVVELGALLLFLYFAFRLVTAMFVPKPADPHRAKMTCGVCGWTGMVSRHKSRCAQCGGTVLTAAGPATPPRSR